MNQPHVPAATQPIDQLIFREGYERIAPEFATVPESELLQINVEITQAVTTAVGHAGRLQALRPDIVATVPSFDLVRYDKIVDYAKALWHADNGHQNALRAPVSLEAQHSLLVDKRDLLVTDLTALVKRGVVVCPNLAELSQGPNGYRATAHNATSIVRVFRANLSVIQGKTAVTEADLLEVEALAGNLVLAVGLREGAPQTVAEASLERQRAFTLFWRAYDDARRIVVFLRWHHRDADEVLPSLYAGRSNGRKKSEEQAEPEPPPVPAATPAASPAASTPAAPVGMPGSNPLVP